MGVLNGTQFGLKKSTSIAQASQIIEQNKANMSGPGSMTYPVDLPGDTRFILMMHEYKYDRQQGNITTLRSIYNLPLPRNISDELGLNYNVTELGAVGGEIAGLVGEVASAAQNSGNNADMTKNVAEAVKGIVNNTVQTAKNASSTDALAGLNAAAASLSSKKGVTNATGVVGSILGQVPNPHAITLFKGVTLKKYSFSWTLMPRMKVESQIIARMINNIRRDALPERKLGGLTLSYPYEAQVIMMSNGTESLMRFKPSFITSMNVNFTAGGSLALLEDGYPASVQIAISFQENDIWSREDYGQSTTSAGMFT